MHRQWLLGIIAMAGWAGAQTQVDLGNQSKDVDFSQAASTRPLKSGTALPANCAVGQMFYLTNAASGANLYGCTATNTWSVEGSGSAVESAGQLTDLQPVRTSSTVLTIGPNCSASVPCNVALNGVTYEFTSSMTVTNSATSPLTVRAYVSDGSDGQSAGTLVIGNNAASGVACSGGCVVVNGVSSFPVSAGIITEFVWTATGVSGQWDVTGYTDFRPFQGGGNRLYSTNRNCTVTQSSAGAGITCSGGLWSDLQNPGAVTDLNMGNYASQFTWTDPANASANYQYGIQFINNVDANSTLNPGYNDAVMFDHTYNFNWGQALLGGATTSKVTALINNDTLNATGSGQRIMNNYVLNCWGMSDCARESTSITYAGGNVAGDEARGFTVVSRLQQLGTLVKTSLASGAVRSGCPSGMTLTQSVTASTTPQTVSVSSNTGCQTGDWVVVDWTGPTGYPNWDAVQITAVGTGTISGRFYASHNSGATVKPGVVLAVGSTSQFGQDRVLVDLSGASYSTGTVSFTSGTGTITGSGTSWTNTMVGGEALSPGCIQATAEDQTYAPFGTGANALHSWWEIGANSITSSTSMGIFSFSVAGSSGYNGASFSGSAYTIRPCARILMISGNTVVLSPNNSTWSSGDGVEVALTPYPDNQAFNYYLSAYTPGGTYRGFMSVANNGGQNQGGVINVSNAMVGNTGSGNPAAWTCVLCGGNSSAANPLANWVIDFATANLGLGGIRLPSPLTTSGNGHLTWGQVESTTWVGTASDGNTTGLELCGLGNYASGGGGCLYAFERNPSNSNTTGTYANVGGLQLVGPHAASPAFFAIDTLPGSTQSELFLHGAGYSSASGFKGQQYSDTSGGSGGFIMEYTDNGGTSMPLFTMGGKSDVGGPGRFQGGPGFYVLPENVATSGTNYPSNLLGVAASIWNGTGESSVWAFWDLEPDSGATNSTTHAYLYGPCASPITNNCQYLSAGLDGLTVTGPATADYWASTLGTAIASAATIAPAKYITHVTGTTAITTITPPAVCSYSGKSCVVVLIPDAANVYNTGGNIANALTATTGVPVFAVYDNAAGKWYLR